MSPVEADFGDLLRPHLPGPICLVGGGGKTSLLFALGRALGCAGSPAVLVTSTKMFPPGPEDCAVVRDCPDARLAEVRPDEACIFLSRGVDAASGKVIGHAAEDLDACAAAHPDWNLLVEADGACGRPVKAPLAHEPVIPASTRAVVAVLGLSGLFRPLGEDVVFRCAHAAGIMGLEAGETITPAAAARLFAHPHGLFQHAPAGAARLIFLNQADAPGAREAGEALGREILRLAPEAAVALGAARQWGMRCLRMTL